MEENNAFLVQEKLRTLMRKYAVPCVISLLVGALYNIVDQIFIANASYLGSFGNAANTVVFPLTVVALAIAVMIGDGCCAYVSICLGAKSHENAHKSVGSAVVLCVVLSLILTVVYLIFQDGILTFFGGRVNEETFRYSKEYFFYITLGVPFYMFGQAMNPVIRSDGSPKFAMASGLAGATVNIVLDPVFLRVPLGHDGRGSGHGAGSDPDGGHGRAVSLPHEGGRPEERKPAGGLDGYEALHSAGYLQLSGADLAGGGDGGHQQYAAKIRRAG